MNASPRDGVFYRVWVSRYSRWLPRHWSDVPPRAEAVELADARLLQSDDARQVVEGFNREMLQHEDRLWAIAVPVRLRIDGEPHRGQTIHCPTKRHWPIVAAERAVTRGSSNRPSVRDRR